MSELLHELEARRLFAVSFDFDDVLRITGDFKKTGSPKDDKIVITDDGDGIVVNQNGLFYGPFDSFVVLQIEVTAGGGKDKVLCRNTEDDSIETPIFIDGGAGNDTLEGGDSFFGDDTIVGGSGNDSLAGGLGSDYIIGGPGTDRLIGSLFEAVPITETSDDEDTLYGGSGTDIADYSVREESLFVSNDGRADDGLFGNDFFTGVPSKLEGDNVLPTCENLLGGTGNDCLVGAGRDIDGNNLGLSNSFIDGGLGDDVLFGEVGNDTVIGGKGDDILCGGTGADSLSGGPGTDALLGDYRFLEELISAPIYDFLPFPFLGDTLDGGDGDDIIRGGGDSYISTSGDDSIIGGLGDDSLLGDDGNDVINAGAGQDLLFGDLGEDTLLGGNGDDLTLNYSFDFDISDKDLVDGGDGFDLAQGDVFDKPNPVNTEFFIDTDSILNLPSGRQANATSTVEALAAAVTPKVVSIAGTSKNDAISITELKGIVYVSVNGAKAVTYVAANVRRFEISTGKGNDTVMMRTSKGTNICTVPAVILGASGDDVLIGGSKSDSIYGGAGNDSVNGGEGQDSLVGNEGNDTVNGGAGDDFLNGGAPELKTADGTDVLIGGPGSDGVDYKLRTENLTITMNDDKANDGAAGEKDNVRTDCEKIFSGPGNDNLTGNAASNLITAGAGDDTINGLDGNDNIVGAVGKDKLIGGKGTNFYAMKDEQRDEFDAPIDNQLFGAIPPYYGDDRTDYSTASKRVIGLKDGQQVG